ncbi:type IV toxin-antitoxin system AbiEi family antitoxin domain-containing protein [Bradyrhizobium sp. RDT10]
MAELSTSKLNQLQNELPEGLLVDAAWLRKKGYATNLVSHYVSTGRLEQPARSVYRKPRGALSWQQAVISLQTILNASPLIVGGRTALELQGFAHYLSQTTTEVHLYGPKSPPTWLGKLRVGAKFVFHNSKRLFKNDPVTFGLGSLKWDVTKSHNDVLAQSGFMAQPWGQWDWPLTLSMPERAYLETLDELPAHESFEQADKLMEGLPNLRPRRLQKLLVDCRSVKVKRLFFFFADRHKHTWLKHVDKSAVDLGAGKRMLVKGGKFDSAYQITVPEDLNGV